MENNLFLQNELRRIDAGPLSGEKPIGIGTVRFLVRCPFGTSEVLAKSKEILRVIDGASLKGWPERGEFSPKLPEWFKTACEPQMTQEQAEKWLRWWKSLSPEEQARVEKKKEWSLDNWLYWMEPLNRQWFWWDATSLDKFDHIALAIEVKCWPFPWGALRWLFRAAGASTVEAEE